MATDAQTGGPVRLLGPMFFLSGVTGLAWQGLWGRQLHLVFGTSTFAIATVLAAFMAGLALGGWWMATRAGLYRRPLLVYGVLELVVGAWALIFPQLLSGIEPIYLAFWRQVEPGPVLYASVQLLLVGAALLVPTAAMGATLPLLARFATQRLGNAGDQVGWLYAVNTAGAVAGTFLCGFVLLPGLGLWATTGVTAAANLALGVTAVVVGSRVPETPVAPGRRTHRPATNPAVLWSAAIAGFASLLYEVAYFRVLGLVLGASVYAFSVMLLAFLVGIAWGGRVGGRRADKLWEEGGADRVLAALVAVEVGVGVSAWLIMYLFQELPVWYVWGFDLFGGEESAKGLWAMSCLLAGLVLLAPTFLMGVAFPLAVRAVIGNVDEVGEEVAAVYAANTAGGVLGSALAGFVLLPWLQVTGTIVLGVVVNLGAAVVAALAMTDAALRGRATKRALAVGVGVLALGAVLPTPWNRMVMTAGMYKYVSEFKDHSREGVLDYAARQTHMLYYAEGLSSVVTVAQNDKSGNIWLANNGKVDASTSLDMQTQIMVSLLPMQFVDAPDDVLVIGLASGITAGAVTLVDEVKTLEVVELEPAIVEAAHFFDKWSHHVLDDPRTKLVVNDGRNHVLLARPHSYDLVVSEPSNPWLTGVSNLFTEEFLRMGKERLKPGGVWSQWVQLYGMDESDLRSLIATFSAVYPNVLVYTAAANADIVLIGSDSPLVPDADAVARLLNRPRVHEELVSLDSAEASDIYGTLLMDRDHALELAGDIEHNTDDNLRIEYNAPLHLHVDTQSINLALLRAHAWVPYEILEKDPTLFADTARLWHAREYVDRAIEGMVRAALLTPRDDPQRVVRMEAAFAWFVKQQSEGQPVPTGELLTTMRDDFIRDVVGAFEDRD
jgi:spermidine synthase